MSWLNIPQSIVILLGIFGGVVAIVSAIQLLTDAPPPSDGLEEFDEHVFGKRSGSD